MKYSFNFCHGSRTVGISTSTIFVKARPPARLLCRWCIHILVLSSLGMANVRFSDTRRRTSNYGGGGIGARSVGTVRNDFSVTFWQRQATHTSKIIFCFSRKRGSARTFRCPDTRRLRTILAAIVRSSAAGNRGSGRAAPTCTRQARQVGNGGGCVHIGGRSSCAGIAAISL